MWNAIRVGGFDKQHFRISMFLVVSCMWIIVQKNEYLEFLEIIVSKFFLQVYLPIYFKNPHNTSIYETKDIDLIKKALLVFPL